MVKMLPHLPQLTGISEELAMLPPRSTALEEEASAIVPPFVLQRDPEHAGAVTICPTCRSC
jgi:hypothetical protein